MPKLRLLTGLCVVWISGCTGAGPAQTIQERFLAMGTWVDVTFESPDPGTAAAALDEIEAELKSFERDYYPWAPGALASLNDAIAAGRESEVPAPLASLLRRARDISIASDGCFEPGVGRLVELWGFASAPSAEAAPPDAAAVAATLAASGRIASLEIDGRRVRSADTRLTIDLGGIAKGAAVGDVIARLRAHGIDSALVNAGGDLAAMGRAPGGRAWRVGVREPRGSGLLGTVELGDGEAAFTSGDYERYYEHDGERIHHLLDPRTGRPATHTQAVTVLAADPVLADAAATALFVAGPERWRELAQSLGVDTALRVDASGAVETTAAMAARLRPSDTDHDIIVGSDQESLP